MLGDVWGMYDNFIFHGMLFTCFQIDSSRANFEAPSNPVGHGKWCLSQWYWRGISRFIVPKRITWSRLCWGASPTYPSMLYSPQKNHLFMFIYELETYIGLLAFTFQLVGQAYTNTTCWTKFVLDFNGFHMLVEGHIEFIQIR